MTQGQFFIFFFKKKKPHPPPPQKPNQKTPAGVWLGQTITMNTYDQNSDHESSPLAAT